MVLIVEMVLPLVEMRGRNLLLLQLLLKREKDQEMILVTSPELNLELLDQETKHSLLKIQPRMIKI